MPRKRVTRSQILALEYLLSQSRDLSEFGRRFCVWMVEQTKGLKKNICVDIPGDFSAKLVEEISEGVHDICSSGGTTHIDEVLQSMGTQKVFTFQASAGGGWKVWLSSFAWDEQAIRIPFDLEAINSLKPWPPRIGRALPRRKKLSV